MRSAQNRGSCVFCNRGIARGGFTRHLRTCARRLEAIAAADAAKGRVETLYHLRVRGEIPWYSPLYGEDPGMFWLHLEMRGSAALHDVDLYVRAIWLACCGHLRSFEIGGVTYGESVDDCA